MIRAQTGWGVLCLLTCLPFSVAFAQAKVTDARTLLERVSSATRTLSYDGTFVYLHGNSMDTMRVIHKFDGKTERERLISLTGQASEVIRNKDKVLCVLPNSKKIIIEKAKQSLNSFPALLAMNFSQLEDFYELSLLAGQRVAGRSTQGLSISPRDQYRYGYRIWIDEDNGLLLKTELVDGDKVIEQMMFTSLDLKSDISEKLLVPSMDVSNFEQVNAEGMTINKTASQGWHLSWLPGGFAVSESGQVNLSDKEVADHIVVTDGFSMVSIFIEPGAVENTETEQLQKGALSAVRLVKDGFWITAVGEVPAVTVKAIADAIQSQPAIVQNQ